MAVRNEEFARRWIEKASHDLQSAEYIPDRSGPTDTSAFHVQQAIEKALKGLMTFHGMRAPRIHDLDILAEEVLEEVPEVEDYLDRLSAISKYAVVTRYPGVEDPVREEVLRALDVAREIVQLRLCSWFAPTWPLRRARRIKIKHPARSDGIGSTILLPHCGLSSSAGSIHLGLLSGASEEQEMRE